MEEIEKKAIIEALEECNWIMARAAKKLGITERIIGYKVNKYGIKKLKEFHEGSDLKKCPLLQNDKCYVCHSVRSPAPNGTGRGEESR